MLGVAGEFEGSIHVRRRARRDAPYPCDFLERIVILGEVSRFLFSGRGFSRLAAFDDGRFYGADGDAVDAGAGGVGRVVGFWELRSRFSANRKAIGVPMRDARKALETFLKETKATRIPADLPALEFRAGHRSLSRDARSAARLQIGDTRRRNQSPSG